MPQQFISNEITVIARFWNGRVDIYLLRISSVPFYRIFSFEILAKLELNEFLRMALRILEKSYLFKPKRNVQLY